MKKILGLVLLTSSLFGHGSHTDYLSWHRYHTPLGTGLHVSVGADLLYWKPCAPAFPYVVNVTPSSFGVPPKNADTRVEVVAPTYEYGFRVHGQVRCLNDSLFAKISYTKLDSSDSGRALRLSGRVLKDTSLLRRATLKTHYRAADLRAGCVLYRDYWFYLEPFAGVSYLRFKLRERSFTRERLFFNREVKFNGAGPEAGLKVSSCSIGGFRIQGLFATAALAGSLSARTDPPPKTPAHAVCIPVLNMLMQVTYTLEFCGPKVTGILGWEMRHYFGLIQGNDNFGLYGPYAGFWATF